MSTRVSTAQVATSSLAGIEEAYARLNTAQTQVNTGKQVATVSDDPSGSAQVLEFQERSAELDQFGRTINQAQTVLSTSESALSSITDMARQARTLGVQGASDSTSTDQRLSISNQIDNIITQIAATANTTVGSRYIFSGQRTDTPPLNKTATGYQYMGGTVATNDADVTLSIGRGETMQTNVTGDQVLVPILTALGKLRDDLASGTASTTSSADLTQVDTATNSVLTARADIGSKLDTLTATTTRNGVLRSNYTKLISNIQDTDMPTAIVAMQSAQNAYQAALQSTSRIFQNSLLDFIK